MNTSEQINRNKKPDVLEHRVFKHWFKECSSSITF